MFLEGAFTEAGLPGFDYASFSLRLMEADLLNLVKVLRAVPRGRGAAPRRALGARLLRVQGHVQPLRQQPRRAARRGQAAAGRLPAHRPRPGGRPRAGQG